MSHRRVRDSAFVAAASIAAALVMVTAPPARADQQAPAAATPPATAPAPAPAVAPAAAPLADEPPGGPALQRQLQIDGGLSVIGAGYEVPVAAQVAVQVEVFVFGTYFLPWFDLGQDTKGIGIGIRPTWFANPSGHGLYVTPYVRGVSISADSITGGEGNGVTAGVFVGWAFGLSDTLDLRLGAGAQYIRVRTEPPGQPSELSSTPFVAIDATIGYRL